MDDAARGLARFARPRQVHRRRIVVRAATTARSTSAAGSPTRDHRKERLVTAMPRTSHSATAPPSSTRCRGGRVENEGET